VVVAVRAVSSDADLESIIALRARIDPILETTVDDLRFLASRIRAPLHVLATADGEPAGFGIAGVFPEQEAEPFAFADLGVPSEFRRRGIGSALHLALSEHVRDLGKSALQLEVPEQDTEAIGFFQKRGYVEIERQKAVELDLTALEPELPQPPLGVEIFSWAARPDLIKRMYELYREASADIPGLDAETSWTSAEWRVRELERPSRRHDLSFLAVIDGEVVGYATLDVFPAGGFHGLTAVARAWRRKGVGRVLKRSQIAAAKEVGLERLYTESEEHNEPMRSLNEELGFRPIPGMVVLRGPLAPAREGEGFSQL
jgi:GNAT superfamily N-acetyltransferase